MRSILITLLFCNSQLFGQTYAYRSNSPAGTEDLLPLGKTSLITARYPQGSVVSVSHGVLTQVSSRLFRIGPYTTEGTDTLFIRKGNKVIFSRVFYILPADRIKEYYAIAVWGNITADTATAEELATNLSLIHLDPDNGLYTLDSLCIGIDVKRGDLIGPVCSNNMKPTQEQFQLIKKCKYRDKVWIELIGHSLNGRRTQFSSYKRIIHPKN